MNARAKPPAIAFPEALKTLRKARGLTQEDFSVVSSRTYISALERGLKSPTLEKINAISEVLGVHPLSLLVLGYQVAEGSDSSEELVARVLEELSAVANAGKIMKS